MSWFKENKFLGGLLVVTVLLAAIIISFGMKAGTSLEEVQQQVATKKATLKKDKSLNPYPNPKNAKAKEASLKEVLAKGKEAREKLLAFIPEKTENISGKDFATKLTDTVSRVSNLFQGEKAIPSGFYLGFKKYRGSQPKAEATGVLNYQLDAMEYLLTQASEAGVKQIENLVRESLPQEDGYGWPGTKNAKRQSRGSGRPKRPAPGAVRPPKFEKLPYIAHRMPVEFTFKAPEPVLREFLKRIGNSDEYFFETRIARVLNPASIPSAGKGASSEKESGDGGGGAFGAIEIEGEETAEEEPVESVKVLDKVSGGEELTVYLRADLLLFIEEENLPELK
ncbi:MAG: Amuc_1100 family pilus-like protein [Akkermansiaceae bacterium]